MKRWYYFAPFFVVIAIWWSYGRWLSKIHFVLDSTESLSNFGTFGDSYGALNTLFSGLAFAAIVLSIFLQSIELKHTRREVQAQHYQQAQQVFESSFFQLLNLSNEIVKSFKYRSDFNNGSAVGKASFDVIKTDFVSVALMSNHWGESSEKRYEKFYKIYLHSELGHYFRNLYQVVKFVDGSEMRDKKFYTNIIRAQLSSNELYLLFYNGLSVLGRDKFFPLLIEYKFFEHLPDEVEVLQEDARKYGVAAFGNSPEWRSRFSADAA